MPICFKIKFYKIEFENSIKRFSFLCCLLDNKIAWINPCTSDHMSHISKPTRGSRAEPRAQNRVQKCEEIWENCVVGFIFISCIYNYIFIDYIFVIDHVFLISYLGIPWLLHLLLLVFLIYWVGREELGKRLASLNWESAF